MKKKKDHEAQGMDVKIQCELVSWQQFYNLTRRVVFLIHDSGFKPDIIIAIGRGGYMPARIIADFLQIMNLTSFKIEHYIGAQKNPKAVIRYPLSKDIECRTVLLVDDVCDSGDTFTVARQHLMDIMYPEEIRTAVMHYKKVSSYEPDYYARKMVKWRWIIYPWAVVEDVSGFLQQIEPLPDTVGELQEKVLQDYGIRVPQKTLQDILALSET
jgi:hypoxanthine phosphoribosyltransferase